MLYSPYSGIRPLSLASFGGLLQWSVSNKQQLNISVRSVQKSRGESAGVLCMVPEDVSKPWIWIGSWPDLWQDLIRATSLAERSFTAHPLLVSSGWFSDSPVEEWWPAPFLEGSDTPWKFSIYLAVHKGKSLPTIIFYWAMLNFGCVCGAFLKLVLVCFDDSWRMSWTLPLMIRAEFQRNYQCHTHPP